MQFNILIGWRKRDYLQNLGYRIERGELMMVQWFYCCHLAIIIDFFGGWCWQVAANIKRSCYGAGGWIIYTERTCIGASIMTISQWYCGERHFQWFAIISCSVHLPTSTPLPLHFHSSSTQLLGQDVSRRKRAGYSERNTSPSESLCVWTLVILLSFQQLRATNGLFYIHSESIIIADVMKSSLTNFVMV